MNGTLKHDAEWRDASAIVQAAGLQPYARSPVKTWDALRAYNFILANVSRAFPILDAGGMINVSPICHWLAQQGFAVDVINPEFREDVADLGGKVRYARGDAVETPYPDRHFGAITCLSVIEHGVPPDRFFAEMGRILRPGGYLVISTDYWSEPIDTGRRQCFGAPVKIFTPQPIRDLLGHAEEHGFQATAIIDFRCEEAVVHWLGLSYTFIDFALRKVA